MKFIFFFIFLTNCLVKNNVFAEKDLGCNFLDSEYHIGDDATSKIIYGDKVEPMEIETIDKLNELLTKIETTTGDVVRHNVVNSLNIFLDFYNNYKQNKDKDIKEFYDGYKPSFREKETLYSIIIEIFKKLKEENPTLGKHVYLGISCTRTKELRETIIQEKTTISPDFCAEHIFGVIKFSQKGQIGYIIVDPGLSVIKPVVISPIPELQEKSLGITGENILTYSYSLSTENSKYIINKPMVKDESGNNIALEDSIMLYQIELPYCSFLLSTSKVNLPRPIRMLIKKDSTGKIIGEVMFSIRRKLCRITLSNAIPSNSYTIPFSQYNVNNGNAEDEKRQQEHERFIEEASRVFEMPNDFLVKKIVDTKLLVEDTDFLSKLEALAIKLGGKTQ